MEAVRKTKDRFFHRCPPPLENAEPRVSHISTAATRRLYVFKGAEQHHRGLLLKQQHTRIDSFAFLIPHHH